MRTLHLFLLSVISLLPSPGFAKKTHDDILLRLRELGLTEFARQMETQSPDLVKQIGKSDDITVWAPGNYAVASRFGIHNGKRGGENHDALNSIQITDSHANNDHVGEIKWEKPEDDDDDYDDYGGGHGDVKRRHNKPSSHRKNYRGANFETIYTFLDDPGYINLGDCQEARFVKNYAAPVDGGVACVAAIEVTSGLGIVQNTVRGPFRFKNGVIYEVTDYFTLPQTFTTTMQHLNISRKFFDAVVNTGNIDLFEKSPAVTIFAPIDESITSTLDINTASHILWRQDVFGMFLTPDLIPGRTLYSKSGDPIKITHSETGERLVNGRRFIKPNVVTTNGVIHFIDGPLNGPGTSCKKKCN